MQPESRSGLAYGFAAYGLWGLMPLYFRAVASVRPIELLAHRIVWSVLLLAGAMTLFRRWGDFRTCLAVPRTRWLLLASTLLIAVNWYVFIYGVEQHQIVQNSLGYFINPLLNILLGVLLFHERLRRIQWVALVLAIAGLVYLMAAVGELPWIAFTLACSFALYGLIRKVAPVDGLVGLTIETLFLLPASCAFLVWWAGRDDSAFGRVSWQIDSLLVASGAVTAVPLMCFAQAARRVRLSTLAFLQYLAPSLQFLLAVLVLGEPFLPAQQVSFGLIWLALLLVSIDSLAARRALLGGMSAGNASGVAFRTPWNATQGAADRASHQGTLP
jgi:chloramphenicol-sensitive protein RarD